MRTFGLIGYPLSHSFSREYFTKKFEREGLSDCRFENFPLASATEINSFLDQHADLSGLNVTIPYKQDIISLLDEVEETVHKIKACNCIKFKNRKLIGYNTDITGFEESLKTVLKPFHRHALILGTGGSSKAVEFVLIQLGIPYKFVSRKPSIQHLTYEQLTPALITETNIIINTTPLGMYPDIMEAPDIPYRALTSQHLLFDLIYNPEKSLFLKKGEESGATIKNGLDMLIIQAEESWKIWNN